MISANPLPRSARLPLWLAAASQTRPCLGMGCPHHRDCARYGAVETSELRPIDSCEGPRGVWPGRQPIERDDRAPVPGVDGEGSDND